MGFHQDAATAALVASGGNTEIALGLLLDGSQTLQASTPSTEISEWAARQTQQLEQESARDEEMAAGCPSDEGAAPMDADDSLINKDDSSALLADGDALGSPEPCLEDGAAGLEDSTAEGGIDAQQESQQWQQDDEPIGLDGMADRGVEDMLGGGCAQDIGGPPGGGWLEHDGVASAAAADGSSEVDVFGGLEALPSST